MSGTLQWQRGEPAYRYDADGNPDLRVHRSQLLARRDHQEDRRPIGPFNMAIHVADSDLLRSNLRPFRDRDYGICRHLAMERPALDLPPLKWSSLKYGFHEEDLDPHGKEETHGGGDCSEASAGRCADGTGACARLPDAVRAIGVTEVTYYLWRNEYGGLKGRPGQTAERASTSREHAASPCDLGSDAGQADLLPVKLRGETSKPRPPPCLCGSCCR